MTRGLIPIDGELGTDGIWAWVHPAGRSGGRRPGLLLDRDGVTLDSVPYLSRPEDVRLLPGVAETIAAVNRLGVPVAIMTNQSGVGRGYYGWAELSAVLTRMQSLLVEHGARVDAVFACPYHRDALPPFDRHDHPGRKPNPGMLLRAASELDLELGSCWIVGDTAADLQAGCAAGLAGGVHVLTGLGKSERGRVLGLGSESFRVELADNLRDAAPRLIDSLSAAGRQPATSMYRHWAGRQPDGPSRIA